MRSTPVVVCLLYLLSAAASRADTPPWADLSYRKTFNQLLTDGKYIEAEENARVVLSEAESRYGPESIQAALALNMLTEVYFYSDHVRDAEAETDILRAIAIMEKQLGPEHFRVGVSLRLFAVLLNIKGDYERSRKMYERAVQIHDKTAGQDPREEAYVLQNFASLLTKTGDFSAARSSFERALAIREKYFPPDTLNTAMLLSDFAGLLRETGEYDKARAHFMRAVDIFEKKLGPDHVMMTECLNEFGALLNKMGRPAEAKPVLERTLAIEEKAYGPDHIDIAFVLNNLAASYNALGDRQRARSTYERAIAIATPVYGPSHPEVARILSGYASVLAHLGENRLALQAALRTEQIGRDHLSATIRTLPERQALHYAATRSTAVDVLVQLALRDPAARRPVFDALVRSRALVFDEMAARHRLMGQTNDAEVTRLWETLAAARRQLSRLVVQGPGTFHRVAYAAALDRARADSDLTERALADRSVSFRGEIISREAGAAQITAALATGDAMVSFFRYEGGTARDEPSYVAFVQRAGTADPLVVPLGSARQIDSLIAEVRAGIQAEAEAPGRSPVLAETRYRRVGRLLSNRIWDPLEPALAKARRVFLTPDGELNLIDFSALPARPGGYLVEHGPLLHYLSSERDLVLPPAPQHGSGLLAIGAPAFDHAPRQPRLLASSTRPPVFRGARSSCSEFRSMRFEPLPGSLQEIHNISALWNRSGSGAVLERTGDSASELALKQDAPGKKVVHIAAHGFFMGDACPSTANATTRESPLLFSGIALAGANRRQSASDNTQDGIVTAEEIGAMDLQGVEWAVLSACETGLGRLLAGEGVFGLRRAFQAAGARTVIMSLQAVDDVATQQWMIALYRKRFTSGMNTAESVRAANLELLRARRTNRLSTHPFYWGGFIAVGDWR